MAKLPPEAQVGICRGINSRQFHQANLELITGRTLQELGTIALEYEPLQSSGRRPDFLATFPDAQLFVDATHPEWNAVLERRHRADKRLIDVIEAVIPPGWSFSANRLPQVGLSGPIGPFRRAVIAAFGALPKPNGPTRFSIASADPNQPFHLDLWAPRRSAERAWLAGPGNAEFIAPDLQIRDALKKKRGQLRSLPHPAVVALGGALGASLDDYEIALFGRSFERVDLSGRVVERGFERTGLFARPGRAMPTIAGVLAYVGMDVTAGADPILFRHPRFVGNLPQALLQLEVRTLEPEGPRVEPAAIHGIFDRLSRSAAGR